MDIPDDIVIEIFLRVPAKSLLRLRWACKYLFDLITRDRVFIKKHGLLNHHTNISNNNDDDRVINNTSFLLSNDYYSDSPMYTMNLGDMTNNHDGDGEKLVNMDGSNLHGLCNFGDYYRIGFNGSGNGLILLIFYSKWCNSNKYFLWNPCTREFKDFLPCEPTTYVNVIHVSNIVLGFGYDQTIDDYIVLMRINICTTDDFRIANLNTEIGIYTLGSNSWSTKILADPLVKAHWQKIPGLGLLHNGAFHWIRQQGTGLTFTIISFGITKEELRDIEGPNFISQLPSLRVLNGCLCIIQMKKSTFDIWIMKDYGVKDSWTKLFNINMEKALVDTRSRPYYSLEPVNQYLKDGGILMLTNRKVIASCDSKKNDEARFIYSIRDYDGRFVVATYIESLVSLNSGLYLTLAESKTTTVTKQDLLEYKVDICLVKISQEQN